MTEMLLLRHGQSTWNAERRWQGRADPPLSDLGRAQAMRGAQRLGSVDAIVSSPLERARETALILAEATGIGPVETIETLTERDAGPWSGLTRQQIELDWPGFLAEHRRPEGYENDTVLLERVAPTLDAISARFGSATVLVVCHGGVVNAVETMLGSSWVRLPNLSGRWLTITEGAGERDWILGARVELADENTDDRIGQRQEIV